MFGLVRGLYVVSLVHVILAQQVSPPRARARDPFCYSTIRLTIYSKALRQRTNMCCKQTSSNPKLRVAAM